MGRILQETMVCTRKFRDADGKDILLNNSVHAIMEIELKCSVDKIKKQKSSWTRGDGINAELLNYGGGKNYIRDC